MGKKNLKKSLKIHNYIFFFGMFFSLKTHFIIYKQQAAFKQFLKNKKLKKNL